MIAYNGIPSALIASERSVFEFERIYEESALGKIPAVPYFLIPQILLLVTRFYFLESKSS